MPAKKEAEKAKAATNAEAKAPVALIAEEKVEAPKEMSLEEKVDYMAKRLGVDFNNPA